MKITRKAFKQLALLYLIIPVMIFMLGMIRYAVSIPACLLLLDSVYLISRRETPQDRDAVEIKIPQLITVSVIILAWVFFSGVGEFSWTTADHPYRAAILNDLTERSWPVRFEDGTAFVYYFTYWTPSALLGKAFGMTFARIFLVIQTAAGLMLVFTGMQFTKKKTSLTALTMLILFSSFDFLPFTFRDLFENYEGSWESWNTYLNIHSNTFQLMNVFHQCVPGWLITVLFVTGKDRRDLGLYGALLFLYSPWAAVGAVPVALYLLLREKTLKGVIHYNNIVPPIVVLLTAAPYFLSNNVGIQGPAFSFYDSAGRYILSFVLYLIFEVGIWFFILIFPGRSEYHPVTGSVREDRILLLWCLPPLLLFPFYLMGFAHDLLLRGSMVPMFIMTMMAANKLECLIAPVRTRKGLTVRDAGALVMWFVSALTPILLMMTSVMASFEMYSEYGFDNPDRYLVGSFGEVRDSDYEANAKTQYLTSDTDNLFFNLLAKR